MREILFKGKRLDNGEWVVGHYLTQRQENAPVKHMISVQDMWAFHEININTLGEYIGSKDKNGKLVFEGDSLYANGYYFTVIFENGSFKSVYKHPEDGEMLIIGEDIFTEDYTIIEEV